MSYERFRSFSTHLADRTITFVSKPGLANWDRVSPAGMLLADAVVPAPDARVLCIGAGHGATGAVLAQRVPHGSVALFDPNYIAFEAAPQTLAANAISNARVLLENDFADGTYDCVAIEVPPDRRLARRWLLEAFRALKIGGEMYLAGANDEGIRSVIADAEAVFGGAALLGYKGGSRVAVARKNAEALPAAADWMRTPGIVPGTWHEFAASERGFDFRLRTLPGVFAYDRIDEGTKLLLETLEIPAGAHILDVGCGCGVVGLIASRLGAAQVDMVDVNAYAVAAARENAVRLGIAARVFPADGVPEGVTDSYDLVATNPPFHAGKRVDEAMARAFIRGAKRALRSGGRFLIVANRFLAYEAPLREAFEHVRIVAENRSYRVWQAT